MEELITNYTDALIMLFLLCAQAALLALMVVVWRRYRDWDKE